MKRLSAEIYPLSTERERNSVSSCSRNVLGGGESCIWWLPAKGTFCFLKKGGQSLWTGSNESASWCAEGLGICETFRWQLRQTLKRHGLWDLDQPRAQAGVCACRSGAMGEEERQLSYYGAERSSLSVIFPFSACVFAIFFFSNCAHCMWSINIVYIFKIADLCEGRFWSKGRALLRWL